VIRGYLNVKLCFRATRRELSARCYIYRNVDLWLVRVICGSILAVCGHLRDNNDQVPRVICGLILTENNNLR